MVVMSTTSRPESSAGPSLAEVAARLTAEAAAGPGASTAPPATPAIAAPVAPVLPTPGVGPAAAGPDDASGSPVPPAGPMPAAQVPAGTPGPEHATRRRAARRVDGAWLGGVCTGLAAHLGWPVLVMRLVFVLLAPWQFLGVFVYGVLWLVLPLEQPAEAPGLEAASRTGLRQADPQTRRADLGAIVALIMLAGGLVWLVQSVGMGWQPTVFWPLAFGSVGLALVWRQADTAGVVRQAGRRRLFGWLRVMLGVVLVALAVTIGVATQTGIGDLPKALAIGAVALLGVSAVVAPWAFRTRTQLSAARERQLLADARADMAAHLHDSVLQTLALIQRQADDPKSVAALARKQERELRQWLYGETRDAGTFRSAITAAASDIEDERGVPIDVVVVGEDVAMDGALDAMVRAAREAMLNAAKHSDAARVDVYAEVTEGSVETFVRDRGEGFDPDTVDESRLGIRGSIVDRMARYGGTAHIRSAPGEGTEIRLEMLR